MQYREIFAMNAYASLSNNSNNNNNNGNNNSNNSNNNARPSDSGDGSNVISSSSNDFALEMGNKMDQTMSGENIF